MSPLKKAKWYSRFTASRLNYSHCDNILTGSEFIAVIPLSYVQRMSL